MFICTQRYDRPGKNGVSFDGGIFLSSQGEVDPLLSRGLTHLLLTILHGQFSQLLRHEPHLLSLYLFQLTPSGCEARVELDLISLNFAPLIYPLIDQHGIIDEDDLMPRLPFVQENILQQAEQLQALNVNPYLLVNLSQHGVTATLAEFSASA